MSQLVEWQRKLNAASEKAGLELVRLSAGAKAWVELEKQKRAMKMQPVPRPVDVSVKSRGRQVQVVQLPSDAPPAKE
jgi:hypothetical protein